MQRYLEQIRRLRPAGLQKRLREPRLRQYRRPRQRKIRLRRRFRRGRAIRLVRGCPETRLETAVRGEMKALARMRVLAVPERLAPAVSRDLGTQPDREHRRVGMRKIEREPHGRGRFVPGQDLVVAGCIGKAGALAAMEKRKEALEARFHGVFLDRLKMAAEKSLDLPQEFFEDPGVTEWEYVEEGGILAALWNISGAYEQGISFSLLKIPVSQEIIEVCELFDLNPYRLRSGQCVLMVSDHGWDLAERLREMGAEAAVIGKVERGIARKMTGLGSTGFLERPQPDEVLKLG